MYHYDPLVVPDAVVAGVTHIRSARAKYVLACEGIEGTVSIVPTTAMVDSYLREGLTRGAAMRFPLVLGMPLRDSPWERRAHLICPPATRSMVSEGMVVPFPQITSSDEDAKARGGYLLQSQLVPNRRFYLVKGLKTRAFTGGARHAVISHVPMRLAYSICAKPLELKTPPERVAADRLMLEDAMRNPAAWWNLSLGTK